MENVDMQDVAKPYLQTKDMTGRDNLMMGGIEYDDYYAMYYY